jgi:hypothetical protein
VFVTTVMHIKVCVFCARGYLFVVMCIWVCVFFCVCVIVRVRVCACECVSVCEIKVSSFMESIMTAFCFHAASPWNYTQTHTHTDIL